MPRELGATPFHGRGARLRGKLQTNNCIGRKLLTGNGDIVERRPTHARLLPSESPVATAGYGTARTLMAAGHSAAAEVVTQGQTE